MLYDRLLFVSAEHITAASEITLGERLSDGSALIIYTIHGQVQARCDYDLFTLGEGAALMICERTDFTFTAVPDTDFGIVRFAVGNSDELPFVYREAVEPERCAHMIDDMCRMSHSPDYPEETCHYLLRLLVIELTRRKRDNIDDSELYPKIMQYIEENAAGDLSVAGVAKAFDYSPDHLARNFKEYYGRGLKSAIDAVKLRYICSRVTDETLTNSQLAAECGFKSYKSLAEYFKYNTGMAIAVYRRTKSMEKKDKGEE